MRCVVGGRSVSAWLSCLTGHVGAWLEDLSVLSMPEMNLDVQLGLVIRETRATDGRRDGVIGHPKALGKEFYTMT